MLVFGGSEGGLSWPVWLQAGMLAQHGYATLALGYFKGPGLPSTLSNIPLEYFVKALKILRTQPGVDPHHVLVEGDSRGSEAAQLLGADFPDLVNGVIAGSPSSVANVAYPEDSGAAWTLDGKPVPTAIPDENTRGPILLACGGEDAIWDSCQYTDLIQGRLAEYGFRYPVTVLRYPGAGHAVGTLSTPYFSTTDLAALFPGMGGTPGANQSALAAAHAALLKFLGAQ